MKVLLENFTENIRDEFFQNDQLERYVYEQEEQEKVEEALRDAVIQKQRGFFIEFSSFCRTFFFSFRNFRRRNRSNG